jgi:hypothetical protein
MTLEASAMSDCMKGDLLPDIHSAISGSSWSYSDPRYTESARYVNKGYKCLVLLEEARDCVGDDTRVVLDAYKVILFYASQRSVDAYKVIPILRKS